MEKIYFKIKGARDITFNGKEIAHQIEPEENLAYRIYETEKGNWFFAVTSQDGYLVHQAIVNGKSVEDLIRHLGFSDTAKAIYEQLGIETAKDIDL